MLLLDSARHEPSTTSVDLAELQRENSELLAELRDQRRRRTVRRIRRLSFFGLMLGRVAARRSAKHPKGEQPADASAESGRKGQSDGRAKLLVFFLVLVRVIQSRTPKSTNSAAATALPAPAEVQP